MELGRIDKLSTDHRAPEHDELLTTERKSTEVNGTFWMPSTKEQCCNSFISECLSIDWWSSLSTVINSECIFCQIGNHPTQTWQSYSIVWGYFLTLVPRPFPSIHHKVLSFCKSNRSLFEVKNYEYLILAKKINSGDAIFHDY